MLNSTPRIGISSAPRSSRMSTPRARNTCPSTTSRTVRNAIARFNQTEFESKAAKERARRKILSAAQMHGIEVDEDSNIHRPSSPHRAASTKRGPRGG